MTYLTYSLGDTQVPAPPTGLLGPQGEPFANKDIHPALCNAAALSMGLLLRSESPVCMDVNSQPVASPALMHLANPANPMFAQLRARNTLPPAPKPALTMMDKDNNNFDHKEDEATITPAPAIINQLGTRRRPNISAETICRCTAAATKAHCRAIAWRKANPAPPLPLTGTIPKPKGHHRCSKFHAGHYLHLSTGQWNAVLVSLHYILKASEC